MTIQGEVPDLLSITETSERLGDLLFVVANAIARSGGETKEIEACVNIAWDMSNSINTDLTKIGIASRMHPSAVLSPTPHIPNNSGMTIGTRIRTVRESLGMSTFSLAQAIGVPRPCVEAWEDGSTIPASDKILPLAILLRCDPLWLLGDGDGTEPPALLNGEQSPTKISQSTDGNLILGDRIQLTRENLGLSEADLARNLKTYSDIISDWECGITEPAASMIIPLANALKCDPLWLLAGEPVVIMEDA